MLKFSHKKTYVLPGYLPHEMWNADVLENREIKFLRGMNVGGIFYRDVSLETVDQDLDLFIVNQLWQDAVFECRVGPTDFANQMATALNKSAISLEPPRVPRIAEDYGYVTTKFRRPSCFVTPESVDKVGDEIYLVITPRAKKQRFKAGDALLEELRSFNIVCKAKEALPAICLRELPWLSEMRSNTMCYQLHCKEQVSSEIFLGSLIYCIEVVDSIHQRVSVAHAIANFEGNPRVREFWTSPPT